jgi:type II secretory pathway component PulM
VSEGAAVAGAWRGLVGVLVIVLLLLWIVASSPDPTRTQRANARLATLQAAQATINASLNDNDD